MKKILFIILVPVALLVSAIAFGQSAGDLEKDCNKGKLDACIKLGDLYHNGKNVNKDLTRAFTLYSRACDAGNQEACVSLARMYDRGEGVAEDLSRAARLYVKACDEGNKNACDSIRVLYELGENVAFESHTRECSNGNADSCMYLGLLVHYENKINIKRNKVPDALKIYTKECDNNKASGCYYLAVMYENGNGTKKDEARAVSLYKKSCDLGYENACLKINK